jgi:hypothetical protein
MTFVYWIHLKNHNIQEGYIGVSNNAIKRYSEHCYLVENNKHENIHLTRAFKKYKDKIIFSILLESSEDYCYKMETKLRPIRDTGWNIAEGGCKPPNITGMKWTHPPEYGKKISERNKKNQPFLISSYNGSEEQKKMLTEKTKGVSRPWSVAIGKANKGKRMGDENPARRPEVREKARQARLAWWANKRLVA